MKRYNKAFETLYLMKDVYPECVNNFQNSIMRKQLNKKLDKK